VIGDMPGTPQGQGVATTNEERPKAGRSSRSRLEASRPRVVGQGSDIGSTTYTCCV
jgi:hypothetical protein